MSARSFRILLVDDVPDMLEFGLRVIRQLRGVEVDATTNATDALTMAKETSYDLVISDFLMPGADGLSILTAAADRHPEGVRALMSGFEDLPTDIRRVQAARLDAFLRKPFGARDILRLLEAARAQDRGAALEPWRKAAGGIEVYPGAVLAV